jgi:hypothetical protein
LDVETRGLLVQRAAREFAVQTANFAQPDQTEKSYATSTTNIP